MRGHDGIIFVLCLFLCFSVPQMYRIRELSAMSNQRVRLNVYLDTAVESAAYGNFTVTDEKIQWNREGVIKSFEREVKNMLNLDMYKFPVFLIRQGNEAFFYYDGGKWLRVELSDDVSANAAKLQETMEQLLDCSIVSSVFIPTGNESDYCNPIGDNCIFAIMQVRKSVYIVSGSCVLETVI